MIVCVVCNEPKKADHLRASRCDTCDETTSSRSVAGDAQLIAPGSYVTFGKQREWFNAEHGGRHG